MGIGVDGACAGSPRGCSGEGMVQGERGCKGCGTHNWLWTLGLQPRSSSRGIVGVDDGAGE